MGLSPFFKGQTDRRLIGNKLFALKYFEEYLPAAWLDSTVPVIFDFHVDNLLYCLYPIQIGREAIIEEISSTAFINMVISGEWAVRTQQFLNDLNQVRKEREVQIEQLQKQETNAILNRFMGVKSNSGNS